MSNYLTKPALTRGKHLKTLVENRTTYSHNQFELNVFETHLKAHQVELQFSDFVLTSMFRGKKVMHLRDGAFDYLPGESVVIAPQEKMIIDFPEASPHNPTQCLAIEISADLIQNTSDSLNEYHPKAEDCGDWQIDEGIFHMMNGAELAGALNRAVHLSVNETARMKDALLDLTIREMLIRLMQTQARNLMMQRSGMLSTANPMAATVEYMVQNLDQNLSMETLARTACMSRAKFFIQFKRIFGQTPAKMLMELRLRKANELLSNAPLSICEVACRCGFENYSHFTTAFKRKFGQSPSLYRKAKRA